MSEDTARKESSVKEEKVKKLDKFLIGNVIALMILITSSSYVSFDYIQNIDLLKHPRKERVQLLVHVVLYASSFGGILFAFLSDCAFPDYQVELGEAVLSSIGGVVVVIVNFFYPMSPYTVYACLFPFMLEMVTTPNTWSFLLHQTRVINVEIDWVLSFSLLGTLVLMSVFKICSEVIRYFSDNETVSHFFTLWQLISSMSRVLTLLMVSNRVDKPKVSFLPFATVALVTFEKIRRYFRRCSQTKETETKFQEVDVFYTERFWAVLRIMIFFMPFGLGAMAVYVVAKNVEAYLLKAKSSLLENFYSFYFIGGSFLTFFYFFGLAPLLKKKKFWTKELRHLGIAFVLLMIALTYIGVFQATVFNISLRLKKGYSHLRIFNLVDTEVTIKWNLIDMTMGPYTTHLLSGESSEWEFEIHSEKKNINEKTTLFTAQGKSNVYAISEKGIERLNLDYDFNEEVRGENPLLFFLPTSANVTLSFKSGDKVEKLKPNNSTAKESLPDKGLYEIETVEAEPKKLLEYLFDTDGIYAILVLEPISQENLRIYSLKLPRTVSIYWIVPCAAILALADSIKLYVCMKMVFYQAPPQLRTITIAMNFFMVHSTNFIYFFHINLAEYELFVFIVLSIVMIFFAFFIYCAMKYAPYVFTGHGKL